jgi:hypothetical protein
MTIPRTLRRVVTLPTPAPGQFGPAHNAIEVIRPDEWEDADPFILLMDDRLDGHLDGGPHPHAGFETVTYLVHGSIGAETGPGQLRAGDVEWTTAGKGIIHGSSGINGRLRILQLWVTLPKKDRWTDPDHQMVPVSEAPVRREPGVEVRLYSGTTGSLRSPTRNRVPLTLVDVHLDPGAAVEQELPVTHNGFLYPLDGEVTVGDQKVRPGQIGWLDRPAGDGTSSLRLTNTSESVLRVLLYAGARQSTPIVSYGPFIGDSRADIAQSFERYRAGTFVRY